MDLYSYIVRYDSGFAPNPFYGCCTLATCKPVIRNTARVGDWVIGSGSAAKKVRKGGTLVYAMKISEILTFEEYFQDSRFIGKKPKLYGSRKQARGDNIYFKNGEVWSQLDSFHSKPDGTPNPDHIGRDTKVNRVLISDHFKYFGGDGPQIPAGISVGGRQLCHNGVGWKKLLDSIPEEKTTITNFVDWFNVIGQDGYNSPPFDWNE